MTESRKHSVPVDGAVLNVVDDGPQSGPVVAFAHSILTSTGMWDSQVPHLTGLGYRVLRLDSRGHGGSTHDGSEITVDRLARDVVKVLDALKIQRAHFVGLSLGGMAGFALGQQHASRLASLVICDSRADAPPDYAKSWDDRIAQARQHGVASLVQPTLDRWFGDRLGKVDAQFIAGLRNAIASTSLDGYVETARALQRFDYLAKLGETSTPTTLIVGDQDGVLPGVMADLAKRIPNAKLEVIPSAGHLPNLEHPALFNELLQRHLERVGR